MRRVCFRDVRVHDDRTKWALDALFPTEQARAIRRYCPSSIKVRQFTAVSFAVQWMDIKELRGGIDWADRQLALWVNQQVEFNLREEGHWQQLCRSMRSQPVQVINRLNDLFLEFVGSHLFLSPI